MGNRGKDIVRQSAVIAAACFMLIAAAIGSGAFGGTSVNRLQDGALSESGSYLAPAGPAFSIWSVIYVGLLVYTVRQALPGMRADSRQRRTGWWIALTMVLNGLWLVTAQFWNLPMTVLVIALLVAALARVIVLLGGPERRSWAERLSVDLPMGLHFGWVTIATVANASAWFTRAAPSSWGDQADAWAVTVLIVVLMIGAAAAVVTRRASPAIATAWGLVWVAVGRFTGEPESTVTAITSLVVAVLLVAAAIGAVILRRQPARAT